MRKILLNLNEAVNKDQAQDYIAETFGFGPKYGKNLDALYDELTSISEPTAIGIFMPIGDMSDLDFDYMLYIDQICETFAEAEEDNSALAVIYGDLPLNDGFENSYDGLFGEEDDYYEDESDEIPGFDSDNDSANDSDDDPASDAPGDHDVVLIDINKFRK